MSESADERRLTGRMLAKWTALADGQPMPRLTDITPEAFGPDWRHCILIQLNGVPSRSRLAHVGEAVGAGHRKSDMVEIVSDYSERSLLRLATAKIPAMLAKNGPITFGGTGAINHKPILYRAILLPISSGDDSVTHTLGAISYRIATATDELFNPKDPVSSFIAFASRRMIFAPHPSESR